MRQRLAIIAPLVIALGACGSRSTDQQTAAADPEATASAAAVTVGGQPAEVPLTAQAFVDAAAANNKFEIESSRIVQGSGPGQPLTAFTQMMQRDHQAANDALKKAAGTGADPASVDEQKMTNEQKANLDALRSAGGDLGALYIRQQIAAHEKTLAILKTYAASGDNPALMAYATKTIPVVSHHLDQARALKP